MAEEQHSHRQVLPKPLVLPTTSDIVSAPVEHDPNARRIWWPHSLKGLSRLRRIDAVRSWPLIGAEFLLIFIWTLFISKNYLNLDPLVIPTGGEYLSAIQSHSLWARAAECGWCALWNGNMRGGAPAFVDVYGAMLHPLVIITTLGWGVLNGTKLALVAAFFMAGLAQWWLAYVLGIGRVARVWSAGIVVAAGHLSGRMEIGVFSVVLSTAACSLVLPALILLNRTTTRRSAVLLGLVLGLAALSGQGYMQIGLLFALPATFFLLPKDRDRLHLLMRRYALAAGLGFLLAAPFLIPFFHFLPQFGKDFNKDFNTTQPFAYVPLNLVIDNFEFYKSEVLHKLPYPYLYVNFTGWIPVLLALWSLSSWRNSDERREQIFFVVFAVLAFFLASAAPLIWLARLFPAESFVERLASIRYPSLIAGLAVPAILVLAARGLERLLRLNWPKITIGMSTSEVSSRSLALNARWLLAIPLVLALAAARTFSTNWIQTLSMSPDTFAVLNALRTPNLQWVNPPFGVSLYVTPAIEMNLKLASGIRPWHWRDRPDPLPVLEASLGGPPPEMAKQSEIAKVSIYQAPTGREYASVRLVSGVSSPCSAHGTGGMIDISCQTSEAGRLVVEENSWSGWRAWVDGQAVPLQQDQWLAVALPAGSHTIAFRYWPWDVPLGLALCLAGIAVALYWWFKPEPTLP